MPTQIIQMIRHHPGKQDPNNMPKQTKDELEQREIELKNILRWEDDGGQFDAAKKTEILFYDLRYFNGQFHDRRSTT